MWYCLEWPSKAGNHLGAGIGIVFILLRRRILDGKTGFSGCGTSPGLFPSSIVPKGIKLLYSASTQPTHVSNNHNLVLRNKQSGRDSRCPTPRVTLHFWRRRQDVKPCTSTNFTLNLRSKKSAKRRKSAAVSGGGHVGKQTNSFDAVLHIARKSASQAVFSRMQLTLYATRRTPHRALHLVLL